MALMPITSMGTIMPFPSTSFIKGRSPFMPNMIGIEGP